MKAKKNTVQVIESHQWIKVYINNLLHVAVHRDQWIGVHSWLEGQERWCIDWELKDKTINSEYNKEDLWRQILTEINKIML